MNSSTTRGIDIGIAVNGVPPVLTGLDQVRSRIRQTAQEAKGMTDFLAEAGRQVLSGLGVGIGMGMFQQLGTAVSAAVQGGIRYNAVLETQSMSFKTLLGTATAAQARMQDLARFAASTPFELPEVVAASRLLQSLTGGALASGEALRLVGDAAAASGRGFEETAMWVGRLYAGLESGTPVGEATLRLLEMGLVSGDAKVKLDRLAESGEATGRAMEIIRSTFHRTSGAMEEQSRTLEGLQSTFRDSLNELSGLVTKPLLEPLRTGIESVTQAVTSANKALDGGSFLGLVALIQAGPKAGLAMGASAIEAMVPAIEKLRDRARSLMGLAPLESLFPKEVQDGTGELKGEGTLKYAERMRGLARQSDTVLRSLSSEDPLLGPGNAEGEAAWVRAQQEAADASQFRRDIERETGLAIADQIQAEKEREDLVRSQTGERQQALDLAIKEEERRKEMAYRQSYVGGTATRFGQFQAAAAVDDEAGLGGGMMAGMQESLMQLGTAASNAGAVVSNTLGAAFSTIGDQVAKLILGTVTWGEALANIGRNILTQLVQSMVQFFVNLIARQILTAVVGSTIAATQAAAMASAWAGPAVLASIASYGAAAEVGPAAVTAALASAPAIASLGAVAGYEQGGWTGPGPRDEVAGVVHRGEFVVPADVVDRVGLGRLEGLMESPAAGASGPAVAGGGSTIRIHNYVDREAFLESIRDDVEGMAAGVFRRMS